MNDRSMTFDTFIEDRSNQDALAACKARATHPREHGRLLWIYGPTGCGKSHLLGAVFEQLRHAGFNTYLTNGDDILKALVAEAHGDAAALDTFATYDVLLLDHMDVLDNKSATQERLAQFLLTKCARQQSVILTSTCVPSELKTLLDVCDADTENNIFVKIDAPDTALRKAFALQHLHMHPFTIDEDVLAFLIDNTRSLPQLQGALTAAQFLHQTTAQSADTLWAQQYIRTVTT